MYNWQKELVAKLLEEKASTSGVNVVTLKLSGLLSGEEYFITTEPNSSTHPLFDLMQENHYLKQISQGMRIQAMAIPAGNRYSLSKSSSGVIDYSSLKVVEPSFEPLSFSYGEKLNDNILSDAGEFQSDRPPSLSFVGHTVLMPNTGAIDVDWAATNNDSTESLRDISGFKLDHDYWTAFPEFIEGSPWYFMKHHFSQVGALSDSSLKELGIRVRFNDRGAQCTMDLPHVAGCRRWTFIYYWNKCLMIVGGYLLGEGDDCVYVNTSYWQGNRTQAGMSKGGSAKRLTFSKPNIAADDTYRHSGITIDSWWPLSWNTDFISSIQGNVVIHPKEAEEPIGDALVYSQVADVTVNRVDGFFSKVGYQNYLTGYGVYDAVSDKDKEAVSKYWDTLPDSLMFTFAPERCNGRSLKELPFYKEYVRKRSKACKDNNFMELPYNQEFTMKQVENKLSSLNSLSVWVRDAALSNMVNPNAGDVSISPTTRVTTLTRVTDQSFTYSVNDAALSGQVVLTESSVNSFLDKVQPTTFAGDTSMLEGFLGEDTSLLSDLNSELQGGIKKGFNLNTSVYSFGNGVTYSEVCENVALTGQLAFLCEQVTDFRHFTTRIPLLLKSMMGSSVYPKMMDQFKTVTSE